MALKRHPGFFAGRVKRLPRSQDSRHCIVEAMDMLRRIEKITKPSIVFGK